MQFTASSVPVIQMVKSWDQETQQQLYDYTQCRLRQTLTTNPGATMPSPDGGSPRRIMVDLDLHALQAHGLTPQDVPSGLAKIAPSNTRSGGIARGPAGRRARGAEPTGGGRQWRQGQAAGKHRRSEAAAGAGDQPGGWEEGRVASWFTLRRQIISDRSIVRVGNLSVFPPYPPLRSCPTSRE